MRKRTIAHHFHTKTGEVVSFWTSSNQIKNEKNKTKVQMCKTNEVV